ncbi:peptidase E [Mycolicibacterium sp. 120266]|uniref:Type 1 glutamine amidotransferase-like domain-containing protein n=1 Tax=Mycolicibacterium sp. 120266 TaxID=3090601 RepID=UPI00299F4251|nr:peptidase E [Mycolicibacterium sp. 120266]MDX1876066.1 peptidase E [Mycolicibacterium sp. 120266]
MASPTVASMPADVPTILATSGGIGAGRRTRFEFTALTDFAVELSGVSGRAPRICLLATAMGDDKAVLHHLTEAAQVRGFVASHVALFPMPTVEDITAHLLEQDVVWVFGGSVAGLLAMWRLHGMDEALRVAWHAGVVLTGVSAGSICWHAGGTTDSFGPQLRPVTNGLGFLPYANGVHYDTEDQRRPLLHELVGAGVLPSAYATDDGAGLLYRGTDLAEAVAENDSAGAYFAERIDNGAVETRLDVRRLPR